jgi:ClpP class serine protease
MATSTKRPQTQKIFEYLNGDSSRTLTARQAQTRFGVQNLRARINDLRDMGVDIVTEMRETRTSDRPVAFYSIHSW